MSKRGNLGRSTDKRIPSSDSEGPQSQKQPSITDSPMNNDNNRESIIKDNDKMPLLDKSDSFYYERGSDGSLKKYQIDKDEKNQQQGIIKEGKEPKYYIKNSNGILIEHKIVGGVKAGSYIQHVALRKSNDDDDANNNNNNNNNNSNRVSSTCYTGGEDDNGPLFYLRNNDGKLIEYNIDSKSTLSEILNQNSTDKMNNNIFSNNKNKKTIINHCPIFYIKKGSILVEYSIKSEEIVHNNNNNTDVDYDGNDGNKEVSKEISIVIAMTPASLLQSSTSRSRHHMTSRGGSSNNLNSSTDNISSSSSHSSLPSYMTEKNNGNGNGGHNGDGDGVMKRETLRSRREKSRSKLLLNENNMTNIVATSPITLKKEEEQEGGGITLSRLSTGESQESQDDSTSNRSTSTNGRASPVSTPSPLAASKPKKQTRNNLKSLSSSSSSSITSTTTASSTMAKRNTNSPNQLSPKHLKTNKKGINGSSSKPNTTPRKSRTDVSSTSSSKRVSSTSSSPSSSPKRMSSSTPRNTSSPSSPPTTPPVKGMKKVLPTSGGVGIQRINSSETTGRVSMSCDRPSPNTLNGGRRSVTKPPVRSRNKPSPSPSSSSITNRTSAVEASGEDTNSTTYPEEATLTPSMSYSSYSSSTSTAPRSIKKKRISKGSPKRPVNAYEDSEKDNENNGNEILNNDVGDKTRRRNEKKSSSDEKDEPKNLFDIL